MDKPKASYRVRNRIRRLAQEAIERRIIDDGWAIDPTELNGDALQHFQTLNQIANDLAAKRRPERGVSKLHRHLHNLFGAMLAEVLARERALRQARAEKPHAEKAKAEPTAEQAVPLATQPPSLALVEKATAKPHARVKPQPKTAPKSEPEQVWLCDNCGTRQCAPDSYECVECIAARKEHS